MQIDLGDARRQFAQRFEHQVFIHVAAVFNADDVVVMGDAGGIEASRQQPQPGTQ